MAKLGKVCDVRDGTHDSPKYVDNGFPLITSKNLSSGSIDFSDVNYISEEDYTKINQRSKVDIGDIIMPMIGTIGNPVIVDIEPVFAIKNVSLIKFINEEVYNRYILYVLDSDYFKRYIDDKNRGGTQKFISLNDIREFDFVLPDLLTQRQIAANLDKVTHTIDLCNAILEKLDLLVKSRFVEMFGDKKYPYQELISLIIEGAGLSYGIVQPGDDGTGDMGVLRPVDIVDGSIVLDNIKFIDREIASGYQKTELTGKELLITVRGTTGVTAVSDKRFCGMNVTRGIAVIRYDEEKINPIYLNEYLKSDESQRYIQENTRGATLKQINLSDLRIQKILVPPLELQQQFAAFVEQTDKSKSAVKQVLEKAETLKKALMQEYFG